MNPLHKHKMLSVGYQVKQNLKSGDMENLNSLLEFWESVKNDTVYCYLRDTNPYSTPILF